MYFCFSHTPAERESLRCLVILWNTRKYFIRVLTQAHCLSFAPQKRFVCLCVCVCVCWGRERLTSRSRSFGLTNSSRGSDAFLRALASSLVPKKSAWNCNNALFVLFLCRHEPHVPMRESFQIHSAPASDSSSCLATARAQKYLFILALLRFLELFAVRAYCLFFLFFLPFLCSLCLYY